jgi:hypothetical protein
MIEHAARELALVTPPTQTALVYVRGALFNPVSMSMMAFAVCVGIGYAGAIGALVACVAFLAVGAWSTRFTFVRREIDRAFEANARHRRECERMRRLRPSGPLRQQQYCELRDLVAEIERTDANDAQRFELQALLDQFVNLAVGHQRCVDALRFAGTSELLPLPDSRKSTRRREILSRRMRHRDQCVRKIEELSDDIEAVDELVRLIAQRIAAPHLELDLDREIERRLWELDEVDAAMEQLSA